MNKEQQKPFGESALARQEADTAAPVGQEIAYLDLGSGGYIDLGSAMTDEQLAKLPKGRHALGIIGTYGVDGYVAAPPASAELRGYRRSQEEAAQEPVAWYLPSEDGYDSCFRDHRTITSCTGNPWAGWIPLYAAPPAVQAVDLEQFRDCVIEAKEVWLQNAENWNGRSMESQYREWVDDCDRLLALIDQQAGKAGGA